MSDRDKMVIGSRRRLLSSDFNDGERLIDRALLELVSAQQLGDAYKAIAAGVGGVLAGLEVRAVAGTNEVEVQPGIALVAQAPTSSLLDPPVNIIELRAATRVPLGGFVDGANPRLVTIEIEAAQVSKLNQQVDVFDPQTGAFGTAAQDIVTGSSPTLSVRAGTAAANPVVALGPGADGWIPLAVVKLATSQASFSDPYVPVLLRRPMLSALGGTLVPTGAVEGGGFSVGEISGAAIGGRDKAELHDFAAELAGLIARAHGPAEFAGNNIRTVSGVSLASLTTTTQALHGYAIKPPWVADYGTIAPSECRQLNLNNLNLFSTPDSVVLGDGGTFPSLAYGNGPASDFFTLQNMLVLFDTQAPKGVTNGSGVGTQAGPPRIDNVRGPHPLIVSSGSITLEASQDLTWGAAQVTTDAVYLGSVAATGVAFTLIGQSYRGRGFVRMIDVVADRPSFSTVASTGVLDPLYPGRLPAMQPGDIEVIPPAATRVEVSSALSNTGAAGTAEIVLKSAFGFGSVAANPSLSQTFRVRYAGADLPGSSNFGQQTVAIERDLTGQAFVTILVGGGGTGQVTLEGYEDPFLAQR